MQKEYEGKPYHDARFKKLLTKSPHENFASYGYRRPEGFPPMPGGWLEEIGLHYDPKQRNAVTLNIDGELAQVGVMNNKTQGIYLKDGWRDNLPKNARVQFSQAPCLEWVPEREETGKLRDIKVIQHKGRTTKSQCRPDPRPDPPAQAKDAPAARCRRARSVRILAPESADTDDESSAGASVPSNDEDDISCVQDDTSYATSSAEDEDSESSDEDEYSDEDQDSESSAAPPNRHLRKGDLRSSASSRSSSSSYRPRKKLRVEQPGERTNSKLYTPRVNNKLYTLWLRMRNEGQLDREREGVNTWDGRLTMARILKLPARTAQKLVAEECDRRASLKQQIEALKEEYKRKRHGADSDATFLLEQIDRSNEELRRQLRETLANFKKEGIYDEEHAQRSDNFYAIKALFAAKHQPAELVHLADQLLQQIGEHDLWNKCFFASKVRKHGLEQHFPGLKLFWQLHEVVLDKTLLELEKTGDSAARGSGSVRKTQAK